MEEREKRFVYSGAIKWITWTLFYRDAKQNYPTDISLKTGSILGACETRSFQGVDEQSQKEKGVEAGKSIVDVLTYPCMCMHLGNCFNYIEL